MDTAQTRARAGGRRRRQAVDATLGTRQLRIQFHSAGGSFSHVWQEWGAHMRTTRRGARSGGAGRPQQAHCSLCVFLKPLGPPGGWSDRPSADGDREEGRRRRDREDQEEVRLACLHDHQHPPLVRRVLRLVLSVQAVDPAVLTDRREGGPHLPEHVSRHRHARDFRARLHQGTRLLPPARRSLQDDARHSARRRRARVPAVEIGAPQCAHQAHGDQRREPYARVA